MKEQLKLRGWVKVVITFLVMACLCYLYNKASHNQLSTELCTVYWFGLIPSSFITLFFVWEA